MENMWLSEPQNQQTLEVDKSMRSNKSPALERVLQRVVFMRMFLPLVALSVVVIGGVGYLGKKSLESQQHQKAKFVARIVDRYLDQAARTLDAVARVAEVAPSKNLAFMQATWEAYGYFDTLYYLGPSGKIMLLVPPDPRYLALDMSSQPDFRQTGKKKKLIISRPFISLRTGNPTVYLIRQLSGGNQMVGELSLGSLQEEIDRGKGVSSRDVVFIMDQRGMLLAHPSSNLVKQQTNQGDLEIFRRGLGLDVTQVYEYAGRMFLGSASRIDRAGWVVVDQILLSVAFSSYIWALGLTLLSSLAIWLVLTWNLRRQLQRHVVVPLVQLSRGIGALSSGDFSRGRALASLPVAFDELAALATNFQHMSDALEARQIALQESEQRYRSLFERVPVALFRSTPTGQHLDANLALVHMLGYPDREALLKIPVPDLYQNPEDREQWRALVECDGIVRDFEKQLKRHDGRVIWSKDTSRVVRGSDGQVLYYEGSLEDITERKKLEDQIRQSQKLEAVGQLAGGVAHDYNNMLGVIIGHAEMAFEKVAQNMSPRKNLEAILAAAHRSTDITRQLLAFARRQTIAPKILDLNETVEGMLKLLRRLIGEDIDLVWVPGEELWPVRMDPSQVDQILANLCVNARDAIGGPGKVTIETKRVNFDVTYCAEHEGFTPGEYVMLAVSDNGTGMDKATLNKIFDPFFTTKEAGKGTGLGLATVYGIVKQNASLINVYSEPGHGSTFRIYIPRYAGEIEHIKAESPAAPSPRGDETILLVEDEPTVLELVKLMLEKVGYTVLASPTPGDAIRIARENSGGLSLLVTDLVMPEMTGRDLMEIITSFYPGLKCLFMSGYSGNVVGHQGVLEEGANLIQKPFSNQELAVKVRKVLDSN
jgi:PAS domain S-box-containing protein